MSTSVSSTGGSGTSASSVFSNPALLGDLLPGYNITALDDAMQAQISEASQPLTEMTEQVSTLSSQLSAWQQLQTDLTNLQNDAQTLAGTSLYQGITASSSNSDSVVATGDGDGVAATYQVTVTSLMAPEIDESAAQSSDTSSLGYTGSVSINGTSIQVSSSDSLQDIANAINSASAGVTATVLQPAGSDDYVLNIASTEGQAITWSDPDGILQGLGVLGAGGQPANNLQPAAEAKYSINGQNLESPTNGDSTSIPGVSLSFVQPTGDQPVTITTSQNQSAITSAFQQFASDYNTFLSDMNTYAGEGGVIEGNAAVLGVAQMLDQTLGTDDASQPNGYQALAQLGVTISAPVGQPQDLQMGVSVATLQQALGDNPAAVAALMNGASGIATQLEQQLSMFVGPNGSVPQQVTNLNTQIGDLNDQINDPNSSVNMEVSEETQQIQTQFENMLTALMQSQSQGQQIQEFMAVEQNNSSSSSSSGGTGYDS